METTQKVGTRNSNTLAALSGLLAAAFIALGTTVLAMLVFLTGTRALYMNRVLPGVSLHGISLSGLKHDQIITALEPSLTYPDEGMLAFTCPAGSLHLNEDCTLFEFDEAGDTIGGARRTVITDLYRRVQPFLRYELNDLVELSPDECPCGSAFRRIRRIHGRADSGRRYSTA